MRNQHRRLGRNPWLCKPSRGNFGHYNRIRLLPSSSRISSIFKSVKLLPSRFHCFKIIGRRHGHGEQVLISFDV
uniref:Uncharacterized protein MANES_18G046700 n=1 Tax=Rhizophora mucronata TaxID=61149 RepID=A0A2P2J8C8_RHIMU